MGYIIMPSGSHWWWVLKELSVLSIWKCFVFLGFVLFHLYSSSCMTPQSLPGGISEDLVSIPDKTDLANGLAIGPKSPESSPSSSAC
jgi:hypothetical protein